MKILVVSPTDLNKLNAGNKIAIYRTLSEFKEAGYEVEYVCFTSEKSLNKNNFNNPIGIRKPKKLNLISFYKMIEGYSYLFTRYYSKELCQSIIDKLSKDNIDTILFQHTYMSIYLVDRTIQKIIKEKNMKVIIDTQVLEYIAYKKYFKENNKNNYIYKSFVKSIEKSEKNFISKADLVITYGKEDYQEIIKFVDKKKIFLKPISMEINKTTNIKRDKSVIFYGTFSWFPNEDGFKFFLKEIYENINKDIKIYIAGRNIPDWIENINKDNIIILGEVESMRETVNDKGLVIVPLRIGGGIRIKILEALSWGKVVISTSAGAEGICDDEKSEFMIIENDPIKFAEAINYYLNNTEMMEKYEINAEKFIRNNYSKQIISENIKLKISSI